MVVEKVHVVDVYPFHPENDPPVTGNSDTPESFHVAFESVEPVSGKVKVRGGW